MFRTVCSDAHILTWKHWRSTTMMCIVSIVRGTHADIHAAFLMRKCPVNVLQVKSKHRLEEFAYKNEYQIGNYPQNYNSLITLLSLISLCCIAGMHHISIVFKYVMFWVFCNP